MQVKFHELVNGEDTVVGSLSLAGGKIVASPADSSFLVEVLSEKIRDLRSGKPLSSADHPKDFLENLRYTYRSPYLWAGKVEA